MDNPDSDTMTHAWNEQSSESDVDNFEVYLNKGSKHPQQTFGHVNICLKTYKGNNLLRGKAKILDKL
ncbi:hypothetical protein BPA01_09340 [Brevibacillus parabrevis]|uniref:Uncharacterized protein n=1 Tax=Brevibacillus parabrevis TaxID=54914 RepID=A0A4Y3PCZ1_BREPA|nr:hypothetical protein BPA01_09340 [Brevibacillus parabrevis]